MNEPTDPRFDDLDLELERRIDAICRRFETDWRAGKRPPIDDYLADDPSGAPDLARPALRAELEALERELRQSDDTMARPDSTAASQAPLPSTIAEAPTIAPGPPPTLPLPRAAPSVHDDATLPPCDDATVDFGSAYSGQPGAPSPTRVRYFGDYEIVREIARGGMGVVFQARQVSLNRPVALKMILAGQLANDTEVRRFYTEAEAAANLDHPRIVPIFEVGQHEGQHYFSMGFVEGQSLAQKLAGGPLPPREAAALMVKVAEAIEYAHQHGVIHRDLKPANILLDQAGNPRVTDFGLAKKLEGDSGLTGSGQIMGTPSYMPPEQAGGKRREVGPAADVYALGATLYALITGRPPFQAATAMDTVLQVISDEPVPPRRLNASVPRDLETICLKCLEKDPVRRYASAAALGEDLRRYLEGEPIVARPVRALERAVKWARRRPAIAALATLSLVSIVVGTVGVFWQWRKAEANFALAEGQRYRAEAKTLEATEKAQSLAHQLYINRVSLAQREWQLNNVGLSEYLLEQCPQPLRNWEWSYCRKLCHLDRLTLPGHAQTRDAARWSLRGTYGLAFSPDGRQLASGGSDEMVKTWDSRSGTLLRSLAGHKGVVFAVAYSPDGKIIASGSFDETIKLWNTATGELIRTIPAGESWIRALAFSPDGRRLVSGSGAYIAYPRRRAEIKLWETASGRLLRTFPGPHDQVKELAFRPDGRQFASVSTEGVAKLWDPDSEAGPKILRGHSYQVYGVSYSPDGKQLATASLDRQIILWDVESGAVLKRLRGHEGWVVGVAFDPRGKVVASAGDDATVRFWNIEDGRELASIRGHKTPLSVIRYSPDGRDLATASEDGQIKVWDGTEAPKGEPRVIPDHRGWAFSVAFSPDGRWLATGGWGIIHLWDTALGRPVGQLGGFPRGVDALAFGPDSKTLAAATSAAPAIQIRDVRTGQMVATWLTDKLRTVAVAFSPDGSLLATGGSDQEVKLWMVKDGRLLRVMKGHGDEIVSLAYSPDGRWIASVGRDNTARLWEAATGREAWNHSGVVQLPDDRKGNGLAFSPDGQILAAASDDNTVPIWSVATGEPVRVLRGHTNQVNAVAFLSPTRIVTSSEDATIKLWDTHTGEDVFTLRGHIKGVLGVACRPDGQEIASVSVDGTARIWDASVPTLDLSLRREAADVVDRLYSVHHLKDDVVQVLRQLPVLDGPVRELALQLAQKRTENPSALNNASWLIVQKSGQAIEEYRRALRYAEAACKLVPEDGPTANTLGVARYRAGQYREAIPDLERSIRLNAPQFGGPTPADLAFLAMSHQKLGQTAEALKTIEKLRALMARKPWSTDDESKVFFQEAVSLIQTSGTKQP